MFRIYQIRHRNFCYTARQFLGFFCSKYRDNNRRLFMQKRKAQDWNFKQILVRGHCNWKGKGTQNFALKTSKKFNVKHDTSSTNNQKKTCKVTKKKTTKWRFFKHVWFWPGLIKNASSGINNIAQERIN